MTWLALVLAALAAPDEPLVLSGALLDVGGEPLTGRVRVYVAPYAGAPAFPDARPVWVRAGAFELRQEHPVPDPGWWVIGAFEGDACVGVLELPVPGEGEGEGRRVDFGTRALQPPPLILAGTVWDGERVVGDRGLELVGGGVQRTARTDSGGRFELRGWEWGRFGVRLVGDGRRDCALHNDLGYVDSGARDARLELPRPFLVGEVRLGEGLAEHVTGFTAWSPWLPADEDVGACVHRIGGGFEAYPGRKGDSPGPETTVGISYAGMSAWKKTIALSEAPAKPIEIDLGDWRLMRVRVVDAAGRPVREATVQVPEFTGEGLLQQTATDAMGELRIPIPPETTTPLEALVLKPRYRPARAELELPETTITLEPPLSIHLAIDGAPALDPERIELLVYAASDDSELGGFCTMRGVCGPGPEASTLTLAIPDVGTWSLRWWLRYRADAGGAWNSYLIPTEPERLQVTAASSGDTFRVEAPTQAILNAADRLAPGR